MKPQGVSIVICCHNGASRLPQTIRHIARQRVPQNIPWELVVVDNGSTDGSARVARHAWRQHEAVTPLTIVYEPVLGLTYARLKGFAVAQYDYIVMCDDDNWLEENYVATAYRIMAEKSNIGAMGGFGMLVFETDPAVPELAYIFAAGPQAQRPGKVVDNKVYGAGCVVRYSAYAKLLGSGFKTLLTDRRGMELTSGGDYELCLALAIMGYDIWYDERLRFTHFITRERLTWEYFLQYAVDSSKSFNVISSYKMVAANGSLNRMPRLAVFRNFLVCWKIFLGINLKRWVLGSRYLQRPLYFRHLVFKYKLMAYFAEFGQMVNTHRMILNFQHTCKPPQHVLKPLPRKEYTPSLNLSFFSKPFRQL